MENELITETTGVLTLKKAIDINGEKVKEIKYDFDEITALDKMRASKEYKKAGNGGGVQELDNNYHFYLFAEAVKKVNDNIEFEDLLRMSAKDAAKAEVLARDFFFTSSEN